MELAPVCTQTQTKAQLIMTQAQTKMRPKQLTQPNNNQVIQTQRNVQLNSEPKPEANHTPQSQIQNKNTLIKESKSELKPSY